MDSDLLRINSHQFVLFSQWDDLFNRLKIRMLDLADWFLISQIILNDYTLITTNKEIKHIRSLRDSHNRLIDKSVQNMDFFFASQIYQRNHSLIASTKT